MSNLNAIMDSEFDAKVLESDIPVLVDFWAPWCGPCRMVAPVLEELAHDYGDRLSIVKVNTDENQQTAVRFGIRGIPTLILFQGGKEVERIVGVLPKPVLQGRLEAVLGAGVQAS